MSIDINNQSITTEQARTILGERSEKLTDKQINDLLVMLRSICNKAIDSTMEAKQYAD